MVDTKQAKEYDYICIGAGSGSMGSGRRAALLNKKVLMIENRVIGGTCVNVGCIPKKVMLNLANFLEDCEVMKDYGVKGTENVKLDFAEFKTARDAYIKRLNGIYERNLENSKVDYVAGTAQFVSDHVVEVEGKQYTAPHVLIASGSYPVLKGEFTGSEFCMTSDGFFEMETLPKSMVFIGGGYIATELAQIMAAMGVKVTMLVRSMILRQCDRDIIDLLMKNMEQTGIDIRLNTKFKHIVQDKDGQLVVTLDTGKYDEEKIVCEQVLYAAGRPPLIDNLKLENTNVKTEKGTIVVDEYQNTTAQGVYAIGDVTNKFTLTPVAIRAGRILSERLFNGKTNLKMLYKNIATVIFSHPCIGLIGYGEEDAIKEYGESKIVVYKSNFINMFYSPVKIQEHKQKSLFKVICLKRSEDPCPPDNQLVIGVQGIGRGVDEMVQGVSIAMTMGATKQDFDNSVAIHPTASEEWVLMDANFIQ